MAAVATAAAAAVTTASPRGFIAPRRPASGGPWQRSGAAAAAATKGKSQEPGYEPFPKDRLRAETDDPFNKVRSSIYALLTAAAGLSLFLSLPRALASYMGIKGAKPLEMVFQDIGLSLGGVVVCGFLAYNEFRTDAAREDMKKEGALIGRCAVWLQGAAAGAEDVAVKLSELRASRRGRARRPILVIGSAEYCLECINTSAAVADAMDRSDFLVVPVVSTPGADATPVAKAATGLPFVAVPDDSEDWQELCSMQLEKVRSQGLDESNGQVVIIKKNGRVATRFLGVPNWGAIAGEVDARVSMGLDTKTI